MNLNLFILIFILTVTSISAQKKEVYLNDDLSEISQFEFNKKNDFYKYYSLQFETDSLITNIKVQRVKKGKISNEKLDSIKSELFKLSNQKIPDSNLIIINYYPGLDRCNSSGNKSMVRANYKRFLKNLKKFEGVSQFFVYKFPEGKEEYGENLTWIKDNSGLIENTFLPIHYPCGSFVLINDEGDYYVNKGEYSIESIIDLIKDKKTTFANTNSL